MNFNKSISEILNDFIVRKYKNYYKMAEQTGIAYMTISNCIKRGLENSILRTVKRLCDAVDITITDLYRYQSIDNMLNSINQESYTEKDFIYDLIQSNEISPEWMIYEDFHDILAEKKDMYLFYRNTMNLKNIFDYRKFKDEG